MESKSRRRTTVGLGWKSEPLSQLEFRAASDPVLIQIEIESCLAQLADLQYVPALQRPEMADYRAELEAKWRSRLAELQAKQVAAAVSLVAAAKAEGVSEQGRKNRRGKSGHGDVTRPQPTLDEQDDLARKLRERYPSDRLEAGKRWMAETGLKDRTWRDCCKRIEWPADTGGRPKKSGGRVPAK